MLQNRALRICMFHYLEQTLAHNIILYHGFIMLHWARLCCTMFIYNLGCAMVLSILILFLMPLKVVWSVLGCCSYHFMLNMWLCLSLFASNPFPTMRLHRCIAVEESRKGSSCPFLFAQRTGDQRTATWDVSALVDSDSCIATSPIVRTRT